MTLQQFLAWEARQELKYEFDGFGPVPMAGGTRSHAIVQSNLAVSIGGRLRGTTCRFFGSDLKIEVAGHIRYPDGFVVCTPGAPRSTVVSDPVVIFEILSPSTSSVDAIVKNQEYAATPSVQRYVMLEQDRVGALVFARSGTDWLGHVLTADATLALPEIGIELPLSELYDGVTFDGEESETPG